MTTTYLRGFVQRAEGDEDSDKPLRIVAATAGRKADGLDLQMETADLGRFERNPVVMYGHQYWGRESLPIGRSDQTWVDDDKLMMDVTFDSSDEFAATVERKYRDGYLNTFSIGFDVWDINEQTGQPAGWELFEVSAVPLPMDPNAVVDDGRARALADLLLADARAGKVLSKTNKKLVKDAVVALNALLDAASDEQEDDERGTPSSLARLEKARARALAAAL